MLTKKEYDYARKGLEENKGHFIWVLTIMEWYNKKSLTMPFVEGQIESINETLAGLNKMENENENT